SYAADNGRVAVALRTNAATFTGLSHPVFGIQRGFTIQPAGANAVWVENFVRNQSDMLWSGGVWALTCTNPAGGAAYGIPLGDGSAWDSFPVLFFKRWGGGHTSLVNDPQLKWTEDLLIINPRGREAKRALFAPKGIIAMRAPRQRCTFLKATKTAKGARYPWGCNIAFYIGPKNFMVEMETMSPEMTLKPGEQLVSAERWILGKLIAWQDLAALATG
ncbi:MAG: hypothetical protein N3A66_10375, partial [Planctomycetota bacterium]|nr:hypothetical protein [Planctomycetota bacterium]